MGIMRIARVIANLFKLGIAAFALMTAFMIAWTFLWPEPDMRALQQADAIICMGGGMDARGMLAEPTLRRVDRCVQLYEAGLAPKIVFTGGLARENGQSAGLQMARYAQTLGLSASYALEEGRAQSTLQNALFTLELIPDARRLIIVTEAFHLPRSWASFRWAMRELKKPAMSLALVMSEDVRRDSITGDVNWNILMRESVAIWFNAGRAFAYSIAPDPSLAWLH